MKRIYPFLFLLSLPFFLSAALHPDAETTIFKHLIEVNQEWENQTENFDFLKINTSFKTDELRIQLHLNLVEQTLRKRDISHLNELQKRKRLQHLEVLRVYAKNSIFPKNIYHSKRQAYFVDHLGTACAVGHLVRESGETELVELITKDDNYAYISELTKYKELLVWAEGNGFTLAELAWIQPGYPPTEKQVNQVGNGGGANGEITVMKSSYQFLYVAGDFTEVDGFAANGIVVWDGENWSALGEGLSGDIEKIETTFSALFVSGDFTIVGTGQQTQLAKYEDGEWTALLDNSFTGDIRDMALAGSGSSGSLFIGGDFSEVENLSVQNIARYSLGNGSWSDGSSSCRIEANAPVNSIFSTGENVYFAGEFSEISTNCQAETTTLETNALAIYRYYEDELSMQPYFGGFEKLDAVHVYNGVLRAYEHRDSETYVHGLTGGVWSSAPYINIEGTAAAKLNGFVQTFADSYATLLYGDTREGGGLSFIFGSGIVTMSEDGFPASSGLILPNGEIKAATHYNGEVYMAGDFTEIQGEAFNGLASSDFSELETSVKNANNIALQIETFQDQSQLITRYVDLEKEADFTLFSMDGRAIATQKLVAGSGQIATDISLAPTGIYFYTITNEQGQMSDKILLVK